MDLKIPSPIVLRQMLPKQTKRTEMGSGKDILRPEKKMIGSKCIWGVDSESRVLRCTSHVLEVDRRRALAKESMKLF